MYYSEITAHRRGLSLSLTASWPLTRRTERKSAGADRPLYIPFIVMTAGVEYEFRLRY
jgi:hypothetical protein